MKEYGRTVHNAGVTKKNYLMFKEVLQMCLTMGRASESEILQWLSFTSVFTGSNEERTTESLKDPELILPHIN
jgi:hypothetical protein